MFSWDFALLYIFGFKPNGYPDKAGHDIWDGSGGRQLATKVSTKPARAVAVITNGDDCWLLHGTMTWLAGRATTYERQWRFNSNSCTGVSIHLSLIHI